MSTPLDRARTRARDIATKRGLLLERFQWGNDLVVCVSENGANRSTFAGKPVEVLNKAADWVLATYPRRPGAPKRNANASKARRVAKRARVEAEYRAAMGGGHV